MSLSAKEPPGAHERTHRNIEGAIAALAEIQSALEQAKYLRIGGDGLSRRKAIDTRELARSPIVAQRRIKTIDFLEGYFKQSVSL